MILPVFYAKAGIPSYWLIDLAGGLTVVTSELDRAEGVYRETGTFSGDETLRADRPWEIEVPLGSVRPRNI